MGGRCEVEGERSREGTVATRLENLQHLEKSGNLTSVREKSGKLGKLREIVVCMWCCSCDSYRINITRVF